MTWRDFLFMTMGAVFGGAGVAVRELLRTRRWRKRFRRALDSGVTTVLLDHDPRNSAHSWQPECGGMRVQAADTGATLRWTGHEWLVMPDEPR